MRRWLFLVMAGDCGGGLCEGDVIASRPSAATTGRGRSPLASRWAIGHNRCGGWTAIAIAATPEEAGERIGQ